MRPWSEAAFDDFVAGLRGVRARVYFRFTRMVMSSWT